MVQLCAFDLQLMIKLGAPLGKQTLNTFEICILE